MHSPPEESTLRTLEDILVSEPDVRFAYLFGSAAEGGMGRIRRQILDTLPDVEAYLEMIRKAFGV